MLRIGAIDAKRYTSNTQKKLMLHCLLLLCIYSIRLCYYEQNIFKIIINMRFLLSLYCSARPNSVKSLSLQVNIPALIWNLVCFFIMFPKRQHFFITVSKSCRASVFDTCCLGYLNLSQRTGSPLTRLAYCSSHLRRDIVIASPSHGMWNISQFQT